MNALEQALAAHGRPAETEREVLLEDARALASHGIFSQRHIWQITGLPQWVVEKEIEKSSKEGGRFNPEMLPLIYDFWAGYRQSGLKDTRLLRTVLDQGVSLGFLAKLTGINKSTMQYWIKE